MPAEVVSRGSRSVRPCRAAGTAAGGPSDGVGGRPFVAPRVEEVVRAAVVWLPWPEVVKFEHVGPLDDAALPRLAGREELVRNRSGRWHQVLRSGTDQIEVCPADVVAVALPESHESRTTVGEDVGVDAPPVVPVVDVTPCRCRCLADHGRRRGIGVGAQRARHRGGGDADALVPRGRLGRRVVHDELVGRAVVGDGGGPGVPRPRFTSRDAPSAVRRMGRGVPSRTVRAMLTPGC